MKLPRPGRPRKSGKPEKITYKGHEATIQMREVSGEYYYRVRYYQSGERKERTIKAESLADATTKVKGILDGITRENGMVKIPEDQFAAIQSAADQLKGVNRTLLASITEYVTAIKLLPPGHNLSMAVAEYVAGLDKKKIKPIDYKDLVKAYLDHKLEIKMRPRAHRDLMDRLTRSTSYLKGPVAGIQTEDIQAFLASLPNVAERTRNNYRGAVVGLFNWAKKRNYLPLGVETSAKMTDTYDFEEEEVGIYTPAVIRTALEKLPIEWRAYLAIGAFAGLRQSELHSLTWANVQLENGYILMTSAKAKTRTRRTIPIQPNLKAWLTPLSSLELPVVPVYKSTNTMARAFSSAWDLAMPPSMPRVANGLRHSFGTYRLKVTEKEDKVAEEMGNSPTMIFKHYKSILLPNNAPITPKIATEYFKIKPAA